MSKLVKVGFGIAGLGAVGGGIGYGVNSLSKKEKAPSLKYKLTSEGFDTNVTDEEWTVIEEAHSKSQNKFNIPPSLIDKKSWLKNHCKGLLEKEDSSNYSKAIQWCVKKEKIVNILNKKNNKFRALSTEASIKIEEKALWKEKMATLKLPTNNVAKESLNALLIGPDDDENIKELQGKCKEVTNTETVAEKFESKLTLAKEWCSTTK